MYRKVQSTNPKLCHAIRNLCHDVSSYNESAEDAIRWIAEALDGQRPIYQTGTDRGAFKIAKGKK